MAISDSFVLSKALAPMLRRLCGSVTLASEPQFENTLPEIVVTPSGIAIEVKPVREKAELPIVVTVSGISIVFNAVQPSKIYPGSAVKFCGRFTLDKEAQPQNA